MTWHKGYRQQIRAAAEALGTFSIRDLARSERIKSFIAPWKVKSIVFDLRKRGEIERLGPGEYRYVGGKARRAGRTPVVFARLARAMHIKGTFSAREIGSLSDADSGYTHRVIRKLVASQDLERVGSRRGIMGKKQAVYRVRHPDAFYLKHIFKGASKTKPN